MTSTSLRSRSTVLRRAVLATLLGSLLATAAIGTTAAADPRAVAPDGGVDMAAVEPQALSSGQLTVTTVVSGLSSPVGVTHAGDGSGRLFVVQRGGLVKIVQGTSIKGTFLDVRDLVSNSGGERGLLGLAFHPDFETNRRLFIYYTRASDGDIVISRLTANSAGTAVPNDAVPQKLLEIEHSQYSNHNGGALAFGPDGYLYIGVGDGGHFGDPFESGQSKSTLLGKVLRIDVDGTGAGPFDRYAIPPGNPFSGATAGLDEIWAYGLRNPWRISFDRANGNLWIADVGQDRREEVNREASGDGGNNYGWDVLEGTLCYEPSSGCDTTFGEAPKAQYSHSGGNCSITGGHVYRGESQRDMQGLYVVGDFCSGKIWTMSATGTSLTQRRDTSINISSFGESESGELYLTNLNGTLYRVIAPEFSDIASSSFLDAIHWLYYEGITGGCGGTRYCPTSSVTRVQMAMFLDRAMDLPATGTDYFTDDDGITGEASINSLAASGITGGCTATTFCPNNRVTREQMAMFLDRALDLPATGTDYFTDDEGKTGEAAINRMAAAGLTGGCSPTQYCPTASVTREQMAAFLRRAFED
jgi:glucose/arabinose dehydrogenase